MSAREGPGLLGRRRLQGAAALLLLTAPLAGCERTTPSAPDLEPPRGASAAGASAPPEDLAAERARASAAASAVASAVVAARSKLSLAPEESEPQGMVFAGEHLARLGGGRLVTSRSPTFAEDLSLATPGATRVVRLADDALLALGGPTSFFLSPKARALVELPRLTLLPGSTLRADPRARERVWLLPRRSDALYPWVLEGPRQRPERLSIDEPVALPGYDGRALAVLGGGALLYGSGAGLMRSEVSAAPRALGCGSPWSQPWRLLPGTRVDTAWWLDEAGRWGLLQVAPACRVVAQGSFGRSPFAAASNAEVLAVLFSEGATEGGAQAWSLAVLDARGKLLFERALALPALPRSGDDWLARTASEREVVLAPGGPWLAVGGPGAVEIWDYRRRERKLSLPALE